MNWSPKIGILVAFLSMLILFLVDVTYSEFMVPDVDEATQNAEKSAAQLSVNRGTLAVYNDITIDKEIATAKLKEAYNKNISVKNSPRKNSVYQISEEPPMISMESIGSGKSYFAQGQLIHGKRDIVIIEGTGIRKNE